VSVFGEVLHNQWLNTDALQNSNKCSLMVKSPQGRKRRFIPAWIRPFVCQTLREAEQEEVHTGSRLCGVVSNVVNTTLRQVARSAISRGHST
jgi:hypothetical protein